MPLPELVAARVHLRETASALRALTAPGTPDVGLPDAAAGVPGAGRPDTAARVDAATAR